MATEDTFDLPQFRGYRAPQRSGPAPLAAHAPVVSVVVPVYFNGDSLEELYARLAKAMAAADVEDWEAIFVDDASRDHSRRVLHDLAVEQSNIRVLHLSRNFGSFAGITAGLSSASGRCVAVISADLQDPPELLE